MIRPCQRCRTRPATQRHHRFPQTKANVKHYGRSLINNSLNIMLVCEYCHSGHADMDGDIWTEHDFRTALDAAGIVLPPPKKSYKFQRKRVDD